jgi:hypothetical protein
MKCFAHFTEALILTFILAHRLINPLLNNQIKQNHGGINHHL